VMDSGRALAVHIYDLAMNVAGGNPNAYATALVLVGLLLLINLLASRIAARWTAFPRVPA
jgi:phosphate transport system permease protein